MSRDRQAYDIPSTACVFTQPTRQLTRQLTHDVMTAHGVQSCLTRGSNPPGVVTMTV